VNNCGSSDDGVVGNRSVISNRSGMNDGGCCHNRSCMVSNWSGDQTSIGHGDGGEESDNDEGVHDDWFGVVELLLKQLLLVM